ncbi:VanZ family protein [Granulicella sp. WH15]|uniref:VanZ family protein n=1 Tax=Granulicella sp. WH15 TaxID=2602070 RepID=UPI001366CF23|nr:VanZ family protein [Granulicella sp. WH15]QHN02393.1 VanZ family protein [Granulicella sp. WH15]
MPNIFRYRPDPLAIRLRTSGLGQVGVWLPTLLAMGVIAIESTPTFGAQQTSGWLRPIFERFMGAMSESRWEEMHHHLRKTGHFTGYGLVCLAFLRSWLITLAGQVDVSLRGWRVRASAAALFSTACIASLDEFHQTMLPNRTGTPWDVLLDSCGGLCMLLLVWLFLWLKSPAEQLN